MEYYKNLEDYEDKIFQMIENRKKWSPEKKEEIEAKEQEMTKRVKEKLDENNIRINNLFSFLYEDRLLKDGKTRKNVIVTSFIIPKFGKKQTVISDSETMEMMYVQTDVTRFMNVEDFFKPRE